VKRPSTDRDLILFAVPAASYSAPIIRSQKEGRRERGKRRQTALGFRLDYAQYGGPGGRGAASLEKAVGGVEGRYLKGEGEERRDGGWGMGVGGHTQDRKSEPLP